MEGYVQILSSSSDWEKRVCPCNAYNFIGFLGIYIAFFEFDIYPENFVEFMGSIGCVWGIAILFLLMRRLRDAGFSPLLALLLYGWDIWRLSDWKKDIFEILSSFFSLVFWLHLYYFCVVSPQKI